MFEFVAYMNMIFGFVHFGNKFLTLSHSFCLVDGNKIMFECWIFSFNIYYFKLRLLEPTIYSISIMVPSMQLSSCLYSTQKRIDSNFGAEYTFESEHNPFKVISCRWRKNAHIIVIDSDPNRH